MDNEKLLEIIEIQQKTIKCLREQVEALKKRQDLQLEALEALNESVMDLYDFVTAKIGKIKNPKK